MAEPAVTVPSQAAVTLNIGGMTCGSCSARIERKLNRLDGVHAEVNFAVEQAHVVHDPAVTVDDLIAVVEGIGYTAALPVEDVVESDVEGPSTAERAEEGALAAMRHKLYVCVLLTVPVVAMAMIPPMTWRLRRMAPTRRPLAEG